MNFFGDGNSEKNKIHLVDWESCLTSKKNGGAGIKNMKIQNQSLIMKWLWNFNSDDQPLRKKVIREKYGLDGRWNTKVSNSPYGVNLWKSIRNLWPKLLTKTMFSIEALNDWKIDRLASFFGTLQQFKGTSTEPDFLIWLRKAKQIYSENIIHGIHNLKQLEWDLALEDDLEGSEPPQSCMLLLVAS
ncbi:hypothetical protein MTR67_004551 [Solanum verrucosum]|uniref:Uncharacterized protein n=1 Tax=Solanum verrucosum TaxID=315347 RepID=A0AAF0TAA7_SOLVR|nr:hypothetical protein MTR67_004551 [Solanum verrucosum]